MNPHYQFVALRAGHRCEYCRAPEEIFNFPLEVEHIISQACGGQGEESNLCLACRSCNLFKQAFITWLDEITQTEVCLFHPRQDQWGEHFQFNFETGEIQGLTGVGRATVARLRMNTPSQMTARLYWRRLEIFP